MANYKAIAVVGRAIINLLIGASRNEFPEAEFKLLQAADFTRVEQFIKEGVSICLYQLDINSVPSNNDVLSTSGPGRERSTPPISLKLSFLITSWDSDLEKRYHLLGLTIQVLHENPILPATLLNQITPNEVIFSPDETVKLVFEPLPLSDLSALLQTLEQPGMLPSVSYSAYLNIGV